VVARVEELVGQSDALVLSDYGKGVLSGDMAPRLIAAARASKLPVLVDPKGTDWTRYTGASVITPNRNELCAAAGLPRGSSLDAMLDGCRRLIETLDLQAIVLTRSEEGLSVVSAGDAEPHHIAAVAREVSDVSGAGDTVVAVLAAALAGGLTLTMAAEIANVAAGIVVAKVGAATATLPEIRRALDSAAPDPAMEDIDAKVMDLATAAVRVQEWSAAGLRVGFTNGCFDLLHPGHVRMLAAARRACDRLVVGLNTDASVTRLKGPSRPIQDADARGAVLSGLASVNAVVTFAEDTPLELITALRPSVLFKGADYRMEDVVGGAFVRSIGGQVLLLDLVPNSSTTRIVERARTLGANPKG
jgi:D-beta-D-heptose 7-phosphate kinase / D-beta-D-heptose 1-phosphate adenosyltransferase